MNDQEVELTDNQVEKLVQYQEVTGIENVQTARSSLEQYQWNVEAAVQNHLSINESPSRSSQQGGRNEESVSNNSRERAPNIQMITYRPQGFMGWTQYAFTLPFKIVYDSLSSLLLFIYRLVIPYPRRLIDPMGDVVSFLKDYESMYGTVHPTFYRGSYSQALNVAKTELKFLLVYLHCRDHQDAPAFCSTILSDHSLIDFINTSVVFWGCSVTSGEGYRVSQALRENSYPFLGLIVLKENRMTVVGRLEGLKEPQALIQQLQVLIRDNEAYLVVARADRQEREFTTLLRQEQDIAYEQSLKEDQEKARRKQEEKDAATRSEQEERNKEMDIQEERDRIRRNKIEWVDRIPEEPEESDSTALHILAKLPNGTRLNRCFKASDSMQSLFYYIFCHPDSPDRFQVTTNFPRKIVPCDPVSGSPPPPSFEEFGLKERTMLFVTDLDA